MYDLPKKVSEFACMCCGERFWTIQGSVDLFKDQSLAFKALSAQIPAETSSSAHQN